MSLLQACADLLAEAASGDTNEKAMKSSQRAKFRASRLENYHGLRADSQALNQLLNSQHRTTQQRKHHMEAQDLRVELTLAKKDGARREMQRAAAALEVSQNIEALEANLRRIATGDVGVVETLPPIGKTPFDHMSRIKQFLPEKAKLQAEVEAYMQQIGAKRASDIDARKERQARRRKLV